MITPVSPKSRFQLLLEPEQLDALREREALTGIPVSRQIRRAIDAWLRVPLLASKAAESEVIKALKETGFMRRPKAAPRRVRARRKA